VSDTSGCGGLKTHGLAGKLLIKRDPTWNVDIVFMAPKCFRKEVSDTTGCGELKTQYLAGNFMTKEDPT